MSVVSIVINIDNRLSCHYFTMTDFCREHVFYTLPLLFLFIHVSSRNLANQLLCRNFYLGVWLYDAVHSHCGHDSPSFIAPWLLKGTFKHEHQICKGTYPSTMGPSSINSWKIWHFSLLQSIQTGSGAHLDSCLKGKRDSFCVDKAAGSWSSPLTSLSLYSRG